MKKYLLTSLSVILFIVISLPSVAFTEANQTIKKEIIYDILIDRFNNGRQAASEQVDIHDPLTYNGGDIKGITLMLDIIAEHGFTAISISPPMANTPKGYHGYWIEDFFEVEEEFGSIDDLKELVKEAHDRDMKVFVELVTNYVAKSSPLVTENSEKGWFKEVEATPTDPTYWLKDVVQFNHENNDVQQYLLDVANFWIEETNIDGYSIHAADQSSTDFLQMLTDELKKKNPNFYIIANTLQGDNIEHLCANENIDAIANEALMQQIQDVLAHVDEPISRLYDVTEKNACDKMLLFADNKNTPRFSNLVADEGRNAITTWKLALAYLYLSPGVPIIYQGSEVPMYGPGFPENQYLVDSISADPDLKKVFEQLASTRDMFPALVHGDFEQVATDKGFSLFKRTYNDQTVYVGINNDSHSRYVKIDELHEDLQLRGLFHDDTIRADDEGNFVVGVERESAEVFIIQPNVGINWAFIGFVIGVMAIFIIAVIYLTIKQKRREK